jgi:hypothetical protein
MNKLQKFKKANNPLILKVESKLDLLIKRQKVNSNELEGIGNELQKGFIGLALRNKELNQKLDIAVS